MCLLVSGNANNGTNAGLRNANSNNTPSNANTNIGAQLSVEKLDNCSLASWQKIKVKKAVLVTKVKARQISTNDEKSK